MPNIDALKELLSHQHEGDEKQLEVIFSEAPRVIVEAPAGYGKTTTMISRIAYLFAAGSIPNPKRILGLTFSVNAALKVKREISEKLPALINAKNNPTIINEKATVTNYHGFCKMVLKKYGYLLFDTLRKDINTFKAIGDNEISKYPDIACLLRQEDFQVTARVEQQIKEGKFPTKEDLHLYNQIISKNLLPMGFITHNAVILFTIDLFAKFPKIKIFYQHYYPLIIVDEFQDTNSIAWELLKQLISNNTQLLFLGDPLQRIYGFIGALPNIMSVAAEQYNMTPIVLNQNYRFRYNQDMLKLDANIRANAQSEFTYVAEENIANLAAFWGRNQEDEANQIADKIECLLNAEPTAKIAILCRARNSNSSIIETTLNDKSINYFYGMFTDEDPDYIDFHIKCQDLFISKFSKRKSISKQSLISFAESVSNAYAASSNKTITSLICLLKALIEKMSIDYAMISPEDKYALLIDIFENRQLKQAMEYIDTNIIITTIHGAKGLEWQYVFLPDTERWIFPGYHTCSNCASKYSTLRGCKCVLPTPIVTDTKKLLLDELSVFYVGVTRARKQVYVSASAYRYNVSSELKSSGFSCMVGMSGIKLINAKVD